MTKLRLIFRAGQSDADGHCVGFNYYTTIVDVPDEFINLEVVGGEWLKQENDKDRHLEGKE